MNTKHRKWFIALILAPVGFLASSCAIAGVSGKPAPLVIQEQGSFAVGGTVLTNPGTFDPVKMSHEGQTFHGDHAYVFYQIPVNARKLPLVLWHGIGQFSKTWETTPDGREGYQNIFLRRGYGVYVIDQPRRGNAGRSTRPNTLTPVADEQKWFNIFRLGIWPNFFPGVQFSRDPEALNQYFRQMTPDTGPVDLNVTTDAVAALFNKIGPGILVTHSHSGGMGWRTAIKSRNVRAIVAYEPGSNFIFPNDEAPPPMPSSGGALEAIGVGRALEAIGVPLSDFSKLTKIPIVIYYGDNIPADQRLAAVLPRAAHRHHHGETAHQKHDCVQRAQRAIQVLMRCVERRGMLHGHEPKGDEQAPEQQDFGHQEHPHAQLAGVQLLLHLREVVAQIRVVDGRLYLAHECTGSRL